ncbi:MAG TPA: hypothetical protein VGI40_06975 [Pirellulaceae bacterium]|jgi:hypothetical protein
MRVYSSPFTVWWKFIFPLLWISGFGAGTAGLWLGVFHGRDNEPPPDWMRWQSLVMWLGFSAFLVWFASRLHRVSLQDDILTASNFYGEISIPADAICRVSQSYMSNPQTIRQSEKITLTISNGVV